MTEPPNPTSNEQRTANNDPDDEFSLLDVLIVLAKHKMFILGMPFLVAVITAGYSLTLPNIFTASTKILQSQAQSGLSAMMAQYGGIAGLVSEVASDKNVYVAMLRSRYVADRLNQRFELMKRWRIDNKYPSLVYDELDRATRISYSKKDGVIDIAVDAEDPKFAAALANAYVDELLRMTSVLAVTEASQRRLFFERQFVLAKDNLANAEVAARQALQTGGLVKVDDQGRAMVEATARLRGQITVKEVQIGAMRTFAADGNPDLQLAQQELGSMKRELGKIEGASGAKASTDGRNGQGLDSLRLLREVKYRETVFELLARQYELAKIDEAKESAVIQVMDKAIEPDRRSRPKRSQMVVLAALVAFFIGIFLVFVREMMAKAKADPQQASRLLDLKRYLLAWR